jgi:uncharacterized protein (DUF952 family)
MVHFHMKLLLKICKRQEWLEAESHGLFEGSADDRRDGFIHLSDQSQVAETARRHFAAQDDLILVAFEEDALGPNLRWEPSRGGNLFPHLHGPLPVASAKWVRPLLWNGTVHVFPPETFA